MWTRTRSAATYQWRVLVSAAISGRRSPVRFPLGAAALRKREALDEAVPVLTARRSHAARGPVRRVENPTNLNHR
jgi:hypothetical protein